MDAGKQASQASTASNTTTTSPFSMSKFSFNFGNGMDISSASSKNVFGSTNSSQATSISPARTTDSPSAPSDQTKLGSALNISESSPPPLPNPSGVTIPVKVKNKNVERKSLGAIPHPDFTFEDGNITFQVAHQTFTIHRYILVQNSQKFKDMIPLGPEPTTEGSPDHPIILYDLDPLHFEKFLRILYPRRFDELPYSTAADWYSVLLVANMFNFTECGIQKLATMQLEKTASGVEKVVWGLKFRIKTLLMQGILEVCNRNESLNAQELVLLQDQPRTVELIMKKRESMYAAALQYARTPISEVDVDKYFKEVLGITH